MRFSQEDFEAFDSKLYNLSITLKNLMDEWNGLTVMRTYESKLLEKIEEFISFGLKKGETIDSFRKSLREIRDMPLL